MRVRISTETRQQQKGLQKSRKLTGSFLPITECKTFHDLILCFDEESIMFRLRIQIHDTGQTETLLQDIIISVDDTLPWKCVAHKHSLSGK